MRTTIRVFAAFLMLVAGGASALTKVDEGIATRVDPGPAGPVPSNRMTRVTAGTDFAHFVQYSGLAAGRTSLRCLLAEPSGKVQVDETELHDDLPAAGYAYCPYETDENDAELGSLTMTMWINGERMSEQVLEVAPGGGGGLSLKRKIKYGLGVLALLVMGAGWWAKRRAKPAEQAGSPAVVAIGSRVAGASAASPAAPADAGGEPQLTAKRYQSALAQADKPRALELGRRYIALLVQDREAAQALQVFRQCHALDPEFRTGRAEDVLPIAKAARAAGEAKVAVAVLRGFDKAWPGHAAIPEVFVFSAQLLAEDLQNGDMARRILQHVVSKYPGHYVASEAKRYLQGMPQAA